MEAKVEIAHLCGVCGEITHLCTVRLPHWQITFFWCSVCDGGPM